MGVFGCVGYLSLATMPRQTEISSMTQQCSGRCHRSLAFTAAMDIACSRMLLAAHEPGWASNPAPVLHPVLRTVEPWCQFKFPWPLSDRPPVRLAP